MSEATVWLIILAGMVGTYGVRLAFLAFFPAERLPRRLRASLRYAPAAVLAAIILPAVALPGAADTPAMLRLTAAFAAGLAAWRTRNTWLTIAVGLAVIWGLPPLLAALAG